MKKIFISLMLTILAAGVSFAEDKSIVIDQESSGISSSYSDGEFTVGGIKFGYTQWIKGSGENTGSIQAKKSITNSFYNVDAIPGKITKIVVEQTGTSRAITMYGGTSAKPTTQVKSPNTAATMEFDFSGNNYTYFSLKTPSNACYFTSITVYYTEGTTPSKKETSMSFGETYDGKKITRTWNPEQTTLETPATLTGGPAGATITYASSDNAVAEVSTAGIVTFLKPGTTTISASYAGNDEYQASTASYTLQINKIKTTTTISETQLEGKVGDPDVTLTATVSLDGAVATFSSTSQKVATVDENTGVVHFVGAGTTVISAVFAGTDYYEASSAACSVSVTDPTIKGDKYVLVSSTDDLKVGDKLVFSNTNHTNLMSAQTANNRMTATVGFAFNADKSEVTVASDTVKVVTLEAGAIEGTFAFNTSDGYLCAASSSSNYLRSKASIDENASAKIEFSDGEAIVTFQGSYTRNILRYNATSKIFSCYESKQQNFLIYKLDNSTPALRGDINKDGVVDVTDVTTLINAVLEGTGVDVEVGDLDGSGSIDVSDVTALINIVLG